jgi:hypothetical protein
MGSKHSNTGIRYHTSFRPAVRIENNIELRKYYIRTHHPLQNIDYTSVRKEILKVRTGIALPFFENEKL